MKFGMNLLLWTGEMNDGMIPVLAMLKNLGFDGVELHCTSGYLPAQFLSTGTNQRSDAYGGGVHNRVRFVLEVLEALEQSGRICRTATGWQRME